MYHHLDVGFKLNSWKFAENIGIEVSYTQCKNLQVSLKTQKNEDITFCILPNQLYMFSHWIPSYKMSRDIRQCILIYSFELNHIVLSTDKFQLIKEHDQAQNNNLEMHSLMSHSFYTKEFDVRACIVDSVEYKMCSIHYFELLKRLANLYTKYTTFQCQHLQQTNKN